MPEMGAVLKQNLPQAGHPVGFCMAQAILEQDARNKLIGSVGNPYKFFVLYHRYAQHKLLPNTTALLQQLQKGI